MSAATYMPLSKIMDVWGRAEGFLIMTVFATLGLILMAASNGIATFCAAYVRPAPSTSIDEHARKPFYMISFLTSVCNRCFTVLDLVA